MKRETYYHGVAGQKYGIWNTMRKCWQFGISEDTPHAGRGPVVPEDRG